MDDLDALIEQLPDGDNPQPAAEVPATPESVAAPNYAALDALVPTDAADIDEDFRDKPLAEVLRIATQHKRQLGVAQQKSQEFNALESRARIAEAAVEFMKQQVAAPRQPQAPQETEQQRYERLGSQPFQVIPELVKEHTAPIEQELRNTQQQLISMVTETAREKARAHLGIPEQAWNKATPIIAGVLNARGWDSRDPRAWYAAGNEWRESASDWVPRPVETPRPAAPPAGGARSQSRPVTTPKLKPRDQENADDMAAAFSIEKGTPAYDAFIASIAGGN